MTEPIRSEEMGYGTGVLSCIQYKTGVVFQLMEIEQKLFLRKKFLNKFKTTVSETKAELQGSDTAPVASLCINCSYFILCIVIS